MDITDIIEKAVAERRRAQATSKRRAEIVAEMERLEKELKEIDKGGWLEPEWQSELFDRIHRAISDATRSEWATNHSRL